MSSWNEDSTTVGTMKAAVAHFLHERDWENSHSPKNLAMSIAIESAELMEIFQWVSSEHAHDLAANPAELTHIREEVADVVIYCLSLSRALDFDLAGAVQDKLAKNALKYPVNKEQPDTIPR